MRYADLKLPVGIYTEETERGATGRWRDGNNVRFYQGLPQKVGGFTDASLDYNGVVRSAYDWRSLIGNKYLGLASTEGFFVAENDQIREATPISQAITIPDGETPNVYPAHDMITDNGRIMGFGYFLNAAGDNRWAAFPLSVDSWDIAFEIGADNSTDIPEWTHIADRKPPILYFQIRKGGISPHEPDYDNIPDVMEFYAKLVHTYFYDGGEGHSERRYFYKVLGNVFWTLSASASYGTFNNFREGNVFISMPTQITGLQNTLSAGEIINVMAGGDDWRAKIITTTDNAIAIIDENFNPLSIGNSARVDSVNILLSDGSEANAVGVGWGVGEWGDSEWGTARDDNPTEDKIVRARTYSLVQWGEDLLINPRYGGLYHFDISEHEAGFARPKLLATAPAQIGKTLVSSQSRQVICFGCTNAEDTPFFDPLLIRWSAFETFDFEITENNSAGSNRIDVGNEIVSAVRTRNEICVFSDVGLTTMAQSGSGDYSLRLISDHCSILSPQAAVEYNGLVFFMGEGDFYRYDGSLSILPCDVKTRIFSDINTEQKDIIVCGTNRRFSEIWWCYPSANSDFNDRYVIYNILNQAWSFGDIGRDFWLDASIYNTTPLAGANGKVFIHENGHSADGNPLPFALSSFDFEIGEGDDMMFLSRIVPDIKDTQDQAARFSLIGKDYPHAREIVKGDYPVDETTRKIDLRLRARQISLNIASENTSPLRFSGWRAAIQPDGKR